MYNEKYLIDCECGRTKEEGIIEGLKMLFNDETIKKTEYRYSPFDFTCKLGFIEFKSRRCTSYTYLTTIIGMNKIDQIQPDLNYYFVFEFTDNVLFCKYDREAFDKFEKKLIGRRDRGFRESSLYCLIPINYLKEFKTTTKF